MPFRLSSRNKQTMRATLNIQQPALAPISSGTNARPPSTASINHSGGAVTSRAAGVLSRSFSPAHRRNKSGTPSLRSIDSVNSPLSNSSIAVTSPVSIDEFHNHGRIRTDNSNNNELSSIYMNNNESGVDVLGTHRRSSSESARSTFSSNLLADSNGTRNESNSLSSSDYGPRISGTFSHRSSSQGRSISQGHRTASSLQSIAYGRAARSSNDVSLLGAPDNAGLLTISTTTTTTTTSINTNPRNERRKLSYPSIETFYSGHSTSSGNTLTPMPPLSSPARFGQHTNQYKDSSPSPRFDSIPDIDEDVESEEEETQGRARADTEPSLAYAMPESVSNRNSTINIDQLDDKSTTTHLAPESEIRPMLPAVRRPSVIVPIDEMTRPPLADVAPFMFDELGSSHRDSSAEIVVVRGRKSRPSVDMGADTKGKLLRKLQSPSPAPPGSNTTGLESNRLNVLQSAPSAPSPINSGYSQLQLSRSASTSSAKTDGEQQLPRHEYGLDDGYEDDGSLDPMAYERGPQRKRSLAQLFHRRKQSSGNNIDPQLLSKSPDDMNTMSPPPSNATSTAQTLGFYPSHSPANSIHSTATASTSLLANTIAVGRRKNRMAQQSADNAGGAGRLPQHFATLPTRGSVTSEETNRRVVITSSAVPRRTHSHGRPSLTTALQATRNTITGGQGTRAKFSVSSNTNQNATNNFTLFDVMREEPDSNIALETPPQAVELRSFWLMRCFERSITSGGYLTSRLYIPRSIWMTKGVKLTALDTKIQACERLRDRLEKMAAVDLEDSDNAVLYWTNLMMNYILFRINWHVNLILLKNRSDPR
ncbi:hypothetical protein BDF19DRAFT_452134 [Syncephalis fuscata]|nr:hypothetical protein BDF19DRAFT_452134 [Syncephalis fuscata]